MPHVALVEAVQQKSAAAVAAAWAVVRAEEARLRDEANRTIDERRRGHAERLRAVAAAAAQAAAADAARQARIIRNDAKTACADRLRDLAFTALSELRDAAYPARFNALAGELPPRHWTRLVVNPADAALAGARFPHIDIRTDARLVGGVIAEDDGLRVDNSLERRLAAAWPELLPAVMKDVLDLVQRSQPAS